MLYPSLTNPKLTGLARYLILTGISLLVACTPPRHPSAPVDLAPVRLDQLPGWATDDLQGLGHALHAQCRLQSLSALAASYCAHSNPLNTPAELRAWLNNNFIAQPLAQPGADGHLTRSGLITGYYEPVLTGSRKKERDNQVPVYGTPAALRAGEPGWSRAAITREPQKPGPALLWLDDPIEAFFMHVQGSGLVKIREADNKTTTVRLAYAQHNGHTYVAIGRAMVDAGLLTREQATAPGIKLWLRNNPARANEVMEQNPRYIFFTEQAIGQPTTGPKGALGVPLTALRSVAVDASQVPLGSLLWLQTRHPATGQLMERLMVAQDVGSAIIGPVRIDVFWGTGDEAGAHAGLARQAGQVWRLVPRQP